MAPIVLGDLRQGGWISHTVRGLTQASAHRDDCFCVAATVGSQHQAVLQGWLQCAAMQHN